MDLARGYEQEHVQQQLIEILLEAKTGLSGVEIAERLGINRATMAKYLSIFAAEGVIKQKNIGNANLWFVEAGTEKLEFPADYFRAKEKFLEFVTDVQQQQAYQLIRNCQYSGALVPKIITEIVVPAIESIDEMYMKAKIGKSEMRLFNEIISNSIQILSLLPYDYDQKKNLVTIAADYAGTIYAQAVACSLASQGWQTWPLGNMSDSIDVMYDLDLQKFLARVWKQRQGIVTVIVFSASGESAKFFAESVLSVKPKFGKNLHLGVFSKAERKNIKAEFVSDKLDSVIQWTDSLSPSMS